MNVPLYPEEFPGTPEYEEIREHNLRLRSLMLDLIAEQEEYDNVQYPYRNGYR